MKVSDKRTAFMISILYLIFLGLIACSDDPVSPQNENTDNAIVSESIGSSGGTIATEKISLLVPAGAFEINNTISIYEYPDDGTFEDNGVSNFFEIRGLPDIIQQPLRLSIKYEGTLENDSYLAIGRLQLEQSTNDTMIIYDMYLAADSSGYVTGELPVNQLSALLKLNTSDFYISDPIALLVSATNNIKLLRTDNFDILYPPTLKDNAVRLGQEMEKVYNIISNDLGFIYTKTYRHWKTPILIQEDIVNGSIRNFFPLLNISRDKVRKSEYNDIRIALGKMFMHLYATQTIPESMQSEVARHYWLEAAVATWLEEKMMANSDFTRPTDFIGNEMAPFNGMRAGAGTGFYPDLIYDHGAGMASMIKYLTDNENFGLTGIKQTYTKINEGNDPAVALHQTAEEHIGSHWWADYLKSFVGGEIYDIDFDYFLDNAHGVLNFNSSGSSLKTFSSTDNAIGPYPDMSAKLFRININNAEMNPDYRMLLSADGPVDKTGLSMIVFGIKAGNPEYLGTTHEQDVKIPDLKHYYDEGYHQYFVVLVNSNATTFFTGDTNIEFTIDIGPDENSGGEQLTYNRCIVGIQFTGDFESNRYGPVEKYTELTEFGSTKIEGGFLGNTFSGIYEDQWGVRETLLITLNDQHDAITSVIWGKVDENTDLGLSESKGFSGINVPVDPDDNRKFEIRGGNACNAISLVYDNWTWADQYITLEHKSCDGNSFIFISFTEE